MIYNGERSRKAFEMRLAGATYRKISEDLSVSVETARKIVIGYYRYLASSVELQNGYRKTIENLTESIAEMVKFEGSENYTENCLPVSSFNSLSGRSRCMLKNMGIEYLEQLSYMKEYELLKIPNFGRKSLNEIKDLCRNYGVTIGEFNKTFN